MNTFLNSAEAWDSLERQSLKNALNKIWPGLEGKKDFNDDNREEITDFVQSIGLKTRTTTTTKVARVHQMLARFLARMLAQLRSGTNNNQSAVLFNYCCSKENQRPYSEKTKMYNGYSEK
ncbi:hypothetical protein TNCV_4776651 [Trichonephila clavipes]|nr:hypothetical protein TNCV_4776651 [Trichonephila clavipes]